MDDKSDLNTNNSERNSEIWRTYLTTGGTMKDMQLPWFELPFFKPFFRALPSAPRYIFNGFCFTISSLANLIMNMQDSPRFAHVSLHGANLEKIENRRVYEFEVACQLEPITAESTGFGDEPEDSPDLGWMGEEDGDALAADRAWNEPPAPVSDEE